MDSESKGNTAVVAGIATAGFGCLAAPAGIALGILVTLIVGGLGVLLWPVVIIVMLFKLGLTPPAGVNIERLTLTADEQKCEANEKNKFGDSDEERAERASEILVGNGDGDLETVTDDGQTPCTVPLEYFKNINDAGKICTDIGPVLIAAQIQYETQFTNDFVGPNGAQGISQVPSDMFEKFGGADPFDAKQSIDTQAKYLCSLAVDSKELINSGAVTETDYINLTLAAYDAGIEAVKEAKGIPEGAEDYVLGVRFWFPGMEGVGEPPRVMPKGIDGIYDE
ncbi:transglycosylase SLT domain-containing protein [Streptomyces tauricus]|uniref:transglycosylase SLT domain-containing protein n=1 Tax=Streptomyces tauricus TaxID=68274 RepID=UPI002244D2D2|nr:transglycosylase SLT domain-containing protein [Streptomyces tauricus]MCW8103512.1 transglycosylase SLT domain-containing protein [Streptomyces tauricus]